MSDVTAIFGMRGCGKSTLTRRLASVHSSVFVFDRLQEWPEHDDSISVLYNFDDFSRWARRGLLDPRSRAVFCGGMGADPDEHRAQCGAILRALYQAGSSSGEHRCVVVEEAQHLSSPASIEPWLLEVVLTGRHANLSLISNSQRPANVHKSLVSQADHLLIGSLYEPRDLAYLRDVIGDSGAVQVTKLPKGSFFYRESGAEPRIVKVF